MGVDYSFYVILGTPVTKDQFFETTDGGVRCRFNHPQEGGAKFCPQDGTPFRPIEQIEPTAKTMDFLKLDVEDPAAAQAQAEEWWHEGPWGTGILGIHKSDARQASVDDGEPERVLGIKLFEGDGEGYRSPGGPSPISDDDLSKARDEILEAQSKLGIVGQIHLYPVIYVSC